MPQDKHPLEREAGGTSDSQREQRGLMLEGDHEIRSNAAPTASPSYFHSYQALEIGFCFLVFLSGLLIEAIGIHPRQRPIPVQELSTGEYLLNPVNNENFEGETVPDVGLMLYGVLLPFFLQLVMSYCFAGCNCHQTLCTYFAALGLTLLTTDLVKTYTGYLRPVFFDFCKPDENYKSCTADEDVQDARKSFPSGHASLSFCCLGLFSCYLERQFGISRFQNRTLAHCELTPRSMALSRLASVFSKAPLLLALFIAASRVVDNKHFPADVVGGSVLGFSIAYWIQGLWAQPEQALRVAEPLHSLEDHDP